MSRPSPLALFCILGLFSGLSADAAPPQGDAALPSATIRRVSVLGRGNVVELEIAASQRLTPQTQVLSAPDRLVLDFPGAVPGPGLHPLALDRGGVKSVRVGLLATHPPVTRVVVDLKTAQEYQLFPSANTVLVKIGHADAAGLAPQIAPSIAAAPTAATTVEGSFIGTVVAGAPQIRLLRAQSPNRSAPQSSNVNLASTVTFRNGLLRIKAQNATLAQVLFEVHQQTGADIGVPAGAAQERVVTDLGPAPPKEVLAALLNGSSYNFIIMATEGDANSLGRVILTPKSGSPLTPATESYAMPEAPQPVVAQPVPLNAPEAASPIPAPGMSPDQNMALPPDQNMMPEQQPQ